VRAHDRYPMSMRCHTVGRGAAATRLREIGGRFKRQQSGNNLEMKKLIIAIEGRLVRWRRRTTGASVGGRGLRLYRPGAGRRWR